MENLTITTKELRKIFELLMAHLNECGIEKFELTDSLYWDIPKEQLYDPNKALKLKEIGLGDLYENWKELKRSEEICETEGYGIVTYDFQYLATIFQWMGYKLQC